ncbi:MAG TPA: PEP/pyruvate-binding domain-containing protein [Solirubrobacterales bacterium]|nr:PEP/pyruvate-binding domain-containing protein [Solirubrobacterales bacterium]
MQAPPSSEQANIASSQWTFGPDEADGRAVDLVGGKGANLISLREDGASVPPFFCVTTRLFDELAEALPASLRSELERPPRRPEAVAELGRRARAELAGIGMPLAAEVAILDAFEQSFGAEGRVVVRSSAVGEDSSTHSFAGQFDTYLNVTRDLLPERTFACLRSALSDRALLYRGINGLGFAAARMGVVVQELVDSAAAGVAFTADPLTGRTDRVVISANLGLGVSVVDGSAAVDSWSVEVGGEIVDRSIARKTSAVMADHEHGHGTIGTELEGEAVSLPVLRDAEVQQVAALARGLAERGGSPQDVEWALGRDGRVYVLQSRPVTTHIARPLTTFDNSNLVESYPGLTSPLTFSLMRRAYQENFRGLVHAFGAGRKRLDRSADIYENLVGLLRGRMYYNLSNWYRMFLQLPGMERALPAFEKAMGFKPAEAAPSSRSLWRRLAWVPAQAWVLLRLTVIWVRLGARIGAYRGAVEECIADLDSVASENLSAHDLQDRLDHYTGELFWKMSAAPISDFFTQQLYGLLGGLIGRWELGEPEALRNELLCGEPGMESIEPVRSLVALSERIGAAPAARELFAPGAAPKAVWARLHEEARFADLAADLDRHVARFGDRSLEELKLETTTLADEPAGLVAILRNYLGEAKSVAAMESHERAIRDAAEARVRAGLRHRPHRRPLFSFVLRRCRRGLKAREGVRLSRGRMAGLLRRLYRALGDRFVEAGLLDRREDLFMLTEREVADAIRGGSVDTDLRRLVALRRLEYEEAGEDFLPSRIEARGIVVAEQAQLPAESPADGSHLTGTGCSPGKVRAPALVVTSPSAETVVGGEILVASTTDPGWVFLMVAASGLVAEQGNMLSHTAIIGRELGVPTVVGVEGATSLIEDGAMIEIDGRAGTVVQLGGESHRAN